MLLLNRIVMAADVACQAGAEDASMASLLMSTVLPFALVIVLMYFIIIRPQRKKEKAVRSMIDDLKVGNEITTIGGIKGKVVSMKDDEITIESSIDRTKISMNKFAVKDVKQYEKA